MSLLELEIAKLKGEVRRARSSEDLLLRTQAELLRQQTEIITSLKLHGIPGHWHHH